METIPWQKVNNTLGVSRLVCFNGKPKQVPQNLISGLMLKSDADGKIIPMSTLKSGDQVKIMRGPFSDFIAKVEKIDEQQRIWVLLDFMGQNTKLQVTHDQVHLETK